MAKAKDVMFGGGVCGLENFSNTDIEWEPVKMSDCKVIIGRNCDFGYLEKQTVSDDFITFCQTGKYPEQKEENEYIHNVKNRLRAWLGDDDGLNVYALMELAVEISPIQNPMDEITFPECVLYEVLDVFESDPKRIINNTPR